MILSRKPLEVTYSVFICSKFLNALCCCCCLMRCKCFKSMKQKLDIHEEANDRLSTEIDILDFIRTSRILAFMTSYSLRRNQR